MSVHRLPGAEAPAKVKPTSALLSLASAVAGQAAADADADDHAAVARAAWQAGKITDLIETLVQAELESKS